MTQSVKKTIFFVFVLTMFMALFVTFNCLAVDQNAPWTKSGVKILNMLTGTTAGVIAALALVAAGLTMAFGELQGGMKKIVSLVIGISIVVGATSLVKAIFDTSASIIFK